MSPIDLLSPIHPIDLEAQRLDNAQNEQYTLISKIALGIFAGIGCLTCNAFLGVVTVVILDSFGIELTENQECMQILEDYEDPLIQKILIASICLFAPIIEEIEFRWGLDTAFQYSQQRLDYDPDSTTSKTMRIAAVSLFFGACHLTPEQGYTNIPIFIITTLLGGALHCLKEETGDIIAPTAAHITHNTVLMLPEILS